MKAPALTYELIPVLGSVLAAQAAIEQLLGGAGRIYSHLFPADVPNADGSGYWGRVKVQRQVVPGGTRSDPLGYDAPTILVVAEVADVADPNYWPHLVLERIHAMSFEALTTANYAEGVYALTNVTVMNPPRLLIRPTPAAMLENPGRWYSTAFYSYLLKPTNGD